MACSARPQSCHWSGLTSVTLPFVETWGLGKFVQPLAVQSKPEMPFEDWCGWILGLEASEVSKGLL